MDYDGFSGFPKRTKETCSSAVYISMKTTSAFNSHKWAEVFQEPVSRIRSVKAVTWTGSLAVKTVKLQHPQSTFSHSQYIRNIYLDWSLFVSVIFNQTFIFKNFSTAKM